MLTPIGLKPWKKKIEAVLKMQAPTFLMIFRGFMQGQLNRDMWPHRSHILALLTAHTGAPPKGTKAPPFVGTPNMQKAFDQMKTLLLLAADPSGAYPNHNEPYHVYGCIKLSTWCLSHARQLTCPL